MSDPTPWIGALRQSYDRFVDLVAPLDEAAVRSPSYDDDWTIAQVASHLGSQAELFLLAIQAGLDGSDPPGPAQFQPVWDRWNALAPIEQADQSLAAGERLVRELETLPAADRDRFRLSLFGRDLDLAGVVGMLLNEHTLHGWDIAVALDPAATLLPAGVELLVDTAPALAGRAGKAGAELDPVPVVTTDPGRSFLLTVDEAVTLTPATGVEGDLLTLPAEALLRLLAGRLDPEHTPAGVDDPRLPALRTTFPGF